MTAPAERRGAITAAVGLALMAVVAPVANAVVPARGAVLGFGVVVVLDMVVAGGLWLVFRAAAPRVAMAQGVVRVGYAVALGAALVPLTAGDGASFRALWERSLAVFGVHLLLVACALVTHRRGPRWIAALVALSGAGYLVDGTRALLGIGGPEVSVVTFVGEVILIGWLIWLAARRGTRAQSGQPAPT